MNKVGKVVGKKCTCVLPGYDQGPVVHHRYGDNKEPVVVGVTCRINHCDLLWAVNDEV